MPRTLRHILIVADESRIASFDWARARREAGEREAFISLVSCHGTSADLIVPVQLAADAPRALQVGASPRTAGAGIGPAVADRVAQAQAMVTTIGHTDIRVLGGATLAAEVWDVAHDTDEVTLEQYDSTGNQVSELVAAPKQQRTTPPRLVAPARPSQTTGSGIGASFQTPVAQGSKVPLPPVASTQPVQANLPTPQQSDAARRQALAEQLRRLETRWKFTEVLWILVWVAVVLWVDGSIINAFADPYASDPNDFATRLGYNFITCVLADCGILIPALICRSVVYALRRRTKSRLQKQL